MSRPNILFLMSDQHRWDAMGCSGDWVQTPNLDRIAAEGVRFVDCVTNSPVCIPARVSLATGWYPHNTSVWDNCRYDLSLEMPTWMQAIRAAGYRTSVFGKTHLHHHGGDLREREHYLYAYGLDDVDEIGGPRASTRLWSHMTAAWESHGLWDAYKADYEERFRLKPHMVRPSALPLEWYADTYVGRQARDYLAAYDRQEPWFCWVSFGGPHEPWDAPEPYASMYDPGALPDPKPRPERAEGCVRGVLDERLAGAPTFENGDISALRANYAGKVTLIDDQIGEILRAIEERGELENTVIAYTSDHGEMNGDHGLIYKQNFYDGAVRVPMLLRTPETATGTHTGGVCESPVEWFDLGPTLADMAGASLDHQQFARSMLPALQDTSTTVREFALSEFRGEVMILGRWYKMAVNRFGKPYMLFDRRADPAEAENLVGRPEVREIEEHLRLQILDRMIQTQIHQPRLDAR